MTQTSANSNRRTDPSELLDALREFIDSIDLNGVEAGTAAEEAQLREIARSIERLERIGVAVPDALRGEKTRLAAALGLRADGAQVLTDIASELEEITKDLRNRLKQSGGAARKTGVKRSRSPKTDKRVLRALIVESLKKRGGSAHKADVLADLERLLKSKLLPGDLEWRESTSDYAWQNNACWERFNMTQEGILRTGSPRGTWELAE